MLDRGRNDDDEGDMKFQVILLKGKKLKIRLYFSKLCKFVAVW